MFEMESELIPLRYEYEPGRKIYVTDRFFGVYGESFSARSEGHTEAQHTAMTQYAAYYNLTSRGSQSVPLLPCCISSVANESS